MLFFRGLGFNIRILRGFNLTFSLERSECSQNASASAVLAIYKMLLGGPVSGEQEEGMGNLK